MKILVDLRKLSEKPSGIGIYTYNFIKGLMEYKELNIIGVTDVMLSYEINKLNKAGLKIISYNKKVDKNIEIFKYFNFLDDVIKRENPEIFWEPNMIMPKNFKKNNPKIKIMLTIHDIFPITIPEYYSLKYKIYFIHFLKKSIHNCDYIVYVSNFTKIQTNRYFKESLNKNDFISYNIVNKLESEFKINDYNYFLYIGNIEKRKGVHILLGAYEEYLKNGGCKSLKIAGNMRDKQIKNKMNDLINKHPNRLEYLGYIDEKTKCKLIYNCSAFIFPSYAEGFGIPPIEALNIGKRVIVSDLNIFHEIIKDGCNYFTLDNDYSKSIKNLAKQLNLVDNDFNGNNLFKIDYGEKKLTKEFVNFISQINN